MGGGIVVAVYKGPRSYDLARQHAQCVTGTDVVPLDIAELPEVMRALIYAELRTELPADVVRDLEAAEWGKPEDITPVMIDVDLDDFEE